LCQNTQALSPSITFSVGGGATGATVSGLPTGLNGSFSAGTFTIAGTPTQTGTFNYTVSTTGMTPCAAATATGTITVNPGPTIALTSAAGSNNQTRCISTALSPNITYSVGGSATGAIVSGLPTGVSGSFSGGTFTISGTPNVSGTFNYTVTTSGGSCGTVSANGTITVSPAPSAAAAGTDINTANCATSATLAATAPTSGTGQWTCTSGCTGVTFSGASSPTSTVNGLTPGTPTTLTWTVSTPGCTASTDQVVVTSPTGPGCAVYCSPTGITPSSTAYGQITNVSFNTINNTTTGANVGFQNFFPSQVTTVSGGASYTLSVSGTSTAGGTPYALQPNCVMAYFDFDGDGGFSDPGEAIPVGSFSNSTTANQTISTNVTIPASTITGFNLPFIVEVLQGACPMSNPCPATGNGQAEQYGIFLLACTTTPANAGPDQTLGSCVNTSTLAATAVNTAAGEIGYWSLLSGNAQLSNMNDPTASVSVLGPSVITLQWTVQSGQSGCPDLTDQMTITTLNLPTAPNAGSDFTTCLSTTSLTGNAPGAGETGLWTVAPTGPTFSAPSSASTNVSGMTVGTTYTFTWTISNAVPCSTSENVVVTTVPSLSANAGPNLASCTGTEINFQGVAPTAGTGTWTGTTGVISSPNSPTSSLNAVNIPGTYTYTWTVSALGCANAVDQMQIVYTFCDPDLDVVTCGVPLTFSDPGGTTGNYSNNEHFVQKYCPSTPGQVIQANFTSVTMATAADHIIVLDGADYTSPIIDDFYSLGTIGNGTSSIIVSNSADGCLTFIFMSNGSGVAAGWQATISCVPPPASQTNVPQCDESNCLGGCLRTLCSLTDQVVFQGNGIGSEELNSVDGGCLAAGEQCSNWFLLNPTSISTGNTSGTLSMNMFVNSGQDQDYAVWEAYAPNLNCPAMTGDSPIRCNFAGSSDQGTGFNTTLDPTYASFDASLTITQNQINNGVYYIILVNTYNPGGSCPQPTVDITFGGDINLGCDPPIPLGSNFISFHGEEEERYNFLMWETLNDEKVAYYMLERSEKGNDWEYVGVVHSNFSTEGGQYSMYDNMPYTPFTYYRIKQVNIDGESEYTQIISVSRMSPDQNWVSNLIPNPATSEFSFQYQGKNFSQPLNVNIYNNVGQLVYSEEHNVENKAAITIGTDHLRNGTYQVMFLQGDNKMMKRLTVVK
jgi:hypothetical protein